jgi:hypothetical protein
VKKDDITRINVFINILNFEVKNSTIGLKSTNLRPFSK